MLWKPAPIALLSTHSTFATGSPLVIFAYWSKKRTRKCMKIADLRNACISGRELETTKAGHQTRKMCSTFRISCVPNEHLQKKQKKNSVGDLAFWQYSACRVDMKTLKSPKDEMTSRYQTLSDYRTLPPCHTALAKQY